MLDLDSALDVALKVIGVNAHEVSLPAAGALDGDKFYFFFAEHAHLLGIRRELRKPPMPASTVVEPAELREPGVALKYAEQIVEMSSHRNPEFMLTLANAYRAAGQPTKARAVAKEGLALLSPETSTTVMSRVRKLLHAHID